MLVNSAYTIFPDRVLPFRSRKLILKHPTISVKCSHLTGLLLKSHLAEKILDSVLDISLRILVYIHFTILIEVDPILMVNL